MKFLGKKSNIFLGSLVKILDVLGFLVFSAGFPKFVLFFSTILTINPTFFLVFLSISWIELVFSFSCQDFRKFSWIVSMILQKPAYLVNNSCKDLCQKSQKSKNFLGRKSKHFLRSLVKILDVLGFLVFLAGITIFFLDFLRSCQEIQFFSWFSCQDLQKSWFACFLAKNSESFLGLSP